MSEIIVFYKISFGSCKFMQHAIFWQIYLCTRFLTDLLDTSCQQLQPIVNVAMNNRFKHRSTLLRPIDRTCKTVIKYSGTLHKYIYVTFYV